MNTTTIKKPSDLKLTWLGVKTAVIVYAVISIGLVSWIGIGTLVSIHF